MFDLGVVAWQGARETLKYGHAVAVTDGDVVEAFWTSYCLWVICSVSASLPDQVGLMGIRMDLAAESTGVPRGSRGPGSAAELLCLQPKALRLCWD